jgi:hypothetical protein
MRSLSLVQALVLIRGSEQNCVLAFFIFSGL